MDQNKISDYDIPDGYITGLDRSVNNSYKTRKAHLYRGSFSDVGLPMCKRGWNKITGGFSIWRNNIGERGICKTCMKRAMQNKEGIEYEG